VFDPVVWLVGVVGDDVAGAVVPVGDVVGLDEVVVPAGVVVEPASARVLIRGLPAMGDAPQPARRTAEPMTAIATRALARPRPWPVIPRAGMFMGFR
jgi:hypothetical protein